MFFNIPFKYLSEVLIQGNYNSLLPPLGDTRHMEKGPFEKVCQGKIQKGHRKEEVPSEFPP